jgi:hypothetical protein
MARLSELEVGRAAIIIQGLIMCKTLNVLSPAHESLQQQQPFIPSSAARSRLAARFSAITLVARSARRPGRGGCGLRYQQGSTRHRT